MQSNYQHLDGPPPQTMNNYALEATKTTSRKSKLIVIGSIIGILVLAAIGTTVGVVVSRNNSKTGNSSSTSPSNGGNSGNNNTPNSDGSSGDPSKFALNPDLRKVFYGMAYTPHNALLDFGCGNTLEGTIKDIQLISQVTTRIRLYGADCNQTAQVLEAIKQTKVDMQVFLGIYTLPDSREAYLRQKVAIEDAIKTYGTDHVAGVTVGNEFMLNWVTGHDTKDLESDIAKEGSKMLVADIDETRTMLTDMNLPKKILVGNSDAGSFFSTEVLSAVDYGLSNVHAWFANVSSAEAAPWVFNFFDEFNVQPAALLANKPQMYIAETGWPSGAKDVGSESNGPGKADLAGLQTFLDTFVCKANEDNIGYFYFEAFDEDWKDQKFGGVEGYWGLFNGDRTMKNVKLPDCLSK